MYKAENLKTAQQTYNALGREAMILGIPITAICIAAAVSIFLMLFALPFLHSKALLLLSGIPPFLLFIRHLCTNDDKACRIFSLRAKWWLNKWFMRGNNVRMFNGTNTILATKFGSDLNEYIGFLEQITQSSSSTRRFSTKCLPTFNK